MQKMNKLFTNTLLLLSFLLLALSATATTASKKIRVKKLPVSISGLGPDIRMSEAQTDEYNLFINGQGTKFTDGNDAAAIKISPYSPYSSIEDFQVSSPQTGSPTLISINPANGLVGQNVNSLVMGYNTNFTTGTQTIWLEHSSQFWSTIYEFSSNVSSTVTRNSQFNIPSNAPTGWYHTRHYSAVDGSLNLSNSFYIASPTLHIISVSPNYAYAGQSGVNLNIDGFFTNFNAASSTMTQLRQGTYTIPEFSQTVNSAINKNGIFNIPSNAPTGWYHLEHTNSINGYLAYANALYVDFAVGSDDLANQKLEIFSLSPNPAFEFININLPEGVADRERQFTLTDLNGRRIRTFKISGTGGVYAVDISYLATGQYLLEMQSGKQKVVQKLLKQ